MRPTDEALVGVGDLFPDLIDVDAPEEVEPPEVEQSSATPRAVQVTQVASSRANGGRLGERLVRRGLLSLRNLQQARVAQARDPELGLCLALTQLGLVEEDTLYRAIAEEYGLPFVDPSHLPINPDALEEVGRDWLRQRGVLPFDVSDKTMMIVTADPIDLALKDELTFRTGKQIAEVVAAPTKLQAALDKHVGTKSTDVGSLINEMEQAAIEIEVDDGLYDDLEEATEHDSAVVKLVNRIIYDAHRRGASDIHIEPAGLEVATRVRLRIDGECLSYLEIPPVFWRAVVSRIKIMAHLDIAERRKPQDGKIRVMIDSRPVELRVATLPTVAGNEDVVMRVLASATQRPLVELGMSKPNLERFRGAIDTPHGLVLCVGPTGSGKTTTLHAALGEINTVERKIWTAEDPVEITQPGLRQVQVQPKIGFDFATALRAFLRADPDVIMVGEMRDLETAAIAVEASMTGHLVFSTLHTNSAPETVSRLLEMGIDPFAFADALRAVLAQRLVRALCGCAHPAEPTTEAYKEVAAAYGGEELLAEDLGVSGPDGLTLWNAAGCPRCSGSGYRGRVALHELLVVDDELALAIHRRANAGELRPMARASGMRTLLQDGIAKALAGQTDLKRVSGVCDR